MEAEFTFLISIYLAAQKGCDSIAGIQTTTAAGCSKPVMSQKNLLSCLSPSPPVCAAPEKTTVVGGAPAWNGNYCCTFNFGVSIKHDVVDGKR